MTPAPLPAQRREERSVGLAAVTRVLLASLWAGFLRLNLGRRYVVLLSCDMLKEWVAAQNQVTDLQGG